MECLQGSRGILDLWACNTGVHLKAHWLALASSDAVRSVDYIGICTTTLQSLHNYINHTNFFKENLPCLTRDP